MKQIKVFDGCQYDISLSSEANNNRPFAELVCELSEEPIKAFERSTEKSLCQSSIDLLAERRLPSRLACCRLTIDRAETAWLNLFHPSSVGKNEDIH